MSGFINTLIKMPTSREMGMWDAAAIKFGIPEIMLMDNAARAAYEASVEEFGIFHDKTVWIFMGAGNNGGDGAAMARHIQDGGGHATIFLFKDPASLNTSVKYHLDLALNDQARLINVNPEKVKNFPDLIALAGKSAQRPFLLVDALLGTGFSGRLKPDYENLINAINSLALFLASPILALDLPSGLNSLNGEANPVAIKARTTVTFAAPKPGLMFPDACKWTGKVICRGICLPQCISNEYPASWRLLNGAALGQRVYPENSFKNTWGHLYIFGGMAGTSGAAHLACAGALRTGSGLVTACAPQSALSSIKSDWPEIMTLAASDQDDWPMELPDSVIKAFERATALVIGPGMGLGKNAENFCINLLSSERRPNAVIDADALTHLSSHLQLLKNLRKDDIITPHPGEAARLLNCQGLEVQKNRIESLDKLCAMTPAVVVLKGAGTLIGHAGETRFLSPYDVPQLAIGGAGDVLAGCIGALVGMQKASGMNNLECACAGVIMHCMAGMILARKFPNRGALASELANELPNAFAFAHEPQKIKGRLPWPA